MWVRKEVCLRLCLCACLYDTHRCSSIWGGVWGGWERERQKERKRDRERARREIESARERKRERGKAKNKESERERQNKRATELEIDRDRDRESESQREREREGGRERETEPQKESLKHYHVQSRDIILYAQRKYQSKQQQTQDPKHIKPTHKKTGASSCSVIRSNSISVMLISKRRASSP